MLIPSLHRPIPLVPATDCRLARRQVTPKSTSSSRIHWLLDTFRLSELQFRVLDALNGMRSLYDIRYDVNVRAASPTVSTGEIRR